MKRPTWATIVGVLAIIFGIVGIFGGAQEMATPSIIEMQKELMQSFSGGASLKIDTSEVQIELGKDSAIKELDIPGMLETMKEQFKLPDWYMSWAPLIGLISMIIAVQYFLSGVFLLMRKPFAIKVFYVAITASIFWTVVQVGVYLLADSGILAAQIPVSLASVVIDLILLAIVYFGSKEAYVELGLQQQ